MKQKKWYEKLKNKKKEATLFLVEDDDVDAMTIQRSLKSNNINNPILRAYDGLEAYQMLIEDKVPKPYIILLDLQMPRMNGLEFLDKIRSEPNLSSAVVFVLTTSKAEKDITASYSKHIAGYFVKGETGENFMDIINVLEAYWKIVHLLE